MSEPVIDPMVFDEISELMDDAIGDFIETYLENSPMLLNNINQALATGDLETVFSQAHQLRGGSGSIGAMQVFQLSNEIEERARAGESEGLGALVVKLQVAYEAAQQELRTFL